MSGVAAKISKDRAVARGLGAPGNPVKYLNQDYETLKARCLASGGLFEDDAFPAGPTSLGLKDWGPDSENAKKIVWKRPAEIKPDPQFIVGGATHGDVRQGSLGDCWLLSAIASLTQNQDFLSLVVPGDQSFQTDYAGIFRFKFWQYGEWVEVVVDDRLPTKSGKLVFVKSLAGNEFWSALLEKAYAKLNGSYEALKGGLPVEALEDLTGGTAELYYLDEAPENLFQIVQKRLKAKALLTCSSKSDEFSREAETVANNSVVRKHAYSVTGAEEVSYRGGKVTLIRVRNPWGYKEWNGAWSDNAPEWNEVDPNVSAALNIRCDDGEVWMPISDFISEYVRVEVCNINLSNALSTDDQKWSVTQFTGSWKKGLNAGGTQKNKDTFWTNPKFWITLEDPDEDYVGPATKPCCTIIVSLMQKDRRRNKPLGANLHPIGYYIYRVPKELQKSGQTQLRKDFFEKNQDVARQVLYKEHREISSRFKLPVGVYMIIPHTYTPNLEADFCLRVFTEKKAGAFGDIGFGINPGQNELSLPSTSVDTTSDSESNEMNQEINVFDAEELQKTLSERLSNCPDIKSDGFSLATCKEMINLFDMDRTGTLGSDEFRILWIKLQKYMEIFKEVDANQSGNMDAYEMQNALQKAGLNLNDNILEVIIQRYGTKDLTISFDDFIGCVIRLETMFNMFQILKTEENDVISLTLYEWVCAAFP
ncbi:calpain-8-like [Spea bombifrons]|uniref:calpain-8-like n=1 Tax=Spea bombifrons TaxID=233779 RepID=UPI00234B3B88|nr:calpain-8-like [Spea bombifrons]